MPILFRALTAAAPRPVPSAAPVPASPDKTPKAEITLTPELVQEHEKHCRQCRAGPNQASYLIDDCCLHPRCGCAASRARVQPWTKLLHCPAGYW